jgi:hypothetical protein
MKFHENPFNDSRTVTCGEKGWRTYCTHFFCNFSLPTHEKDPSHSGIIITPGVEENYLTDDTIIMTVQEIGENFTQKYLIMVI